ncbi:hypothetical protein AAGG49_22015, partial [Stenotrophomonas maltophilia]|uniref:hypothetical protein n=1 Tax=Stenotrophomonas maltophilia TaxID=40324 RepID=UPI00313E75E4
MNDLIFMCVSRKNAEQIKKKGRSIKIKKYLKSTNKNMGCVDIRGPPPQQDRPTPKACGTKKQSETHARGTPP